MLDRPLATRAPAPLRLRALTPDDARAFARGALGVERVTWQCTAVNARSRVLAERLGFRHGGTLRGAYVLRGARYDLDVLSLVGSELEPFR